MQAAGGFRVACDAVAVSWSCNAPYMHDCTLLLLLVALQAEAEAEKRRSRSKTAGRSEALGISDSESDGDNGEHTATPAHGLLPWQRGHRTVAA